MALLYCFLNGEVQTELSKLWSNHRPPALIRCYDYVMNGFNDGGHGGGDRHGNMNNGNGHHQFPHSVTYNSFLTQSRERLNHLAKGKMANIMTNSNTLPNLAHRTSAAATTSFLDKDVTVSSPLGGRGEAKDLVPMAPKSCGSSPTEQLFWEEQTRDDLLGSVIDKKEEKMIVGQGCELKV